MGQSPHRVFGMSGHRSNANGAGGLFIWGETAILVVSIFLIGILVIPSAPAQDRGKPGKCELYGKIQIVEAFPDVKVQVVEAFPDIRVQRVPDFADVPGKWQIVDSLADWKVQIVDAIPDYKIQWVDAFPDCD